MLMWLTELSQGLQVFQGYFHICLIKIIDYIADIITMRIKKSISYAFSQKIQYTDI